MHKLSPAYFSLPNNDSSESMKESSDRYCFQMSYALQSVEIYDFWIVTLIRNKKKNMYKMFAKITSFSFGNWDPRYPMTLVGNVLAM